MTSVKILSEKPISIGELKDDLESIQKRDGELGFRSNKTLEYLNQFVGTENRKDLVKKLQALNIPRLKDTHIIKIADFMPTKVEELKIVLQGYPITINNDNLKKICSTVEESSGKK
ncbi:hypothetical protein HYV84_05840 [Candidatus Woesearchaeota archaeon]|nr:hypothetical protein [Candidatus Woesearchaeota archaeon]